MTSTTCRAPTSRRGSPSFTRLDKRLAGFDRTKLSFDDQIDADGIAAHLQAQLIDLEMIQPWKNNPMEYIFLTGRSLDGIMKRNYAASAVRLRAIIAREKHIPSVYAVAKANLDNPPPEFTETAMRMGRGSVVFFDKILPAWAHEAAGGDAALLADFDATNAAALAGARDYLDWLQEDLMPRSHGTFVLGAEKFAAKLKAEEMIDTPIPELLARGEAQERLDHEAFVAIAKKIDPTKTPAQVFDTVSAKHFSEADLIPQVAKALEDIRKFVVEHDIVTIPSAVRPIVQETPVYSRMGGFASMDTPGAYEEHATEAYYYVTPPEKDWDPKHKEEHLKRYNPAEVANISIHEVFPGHYVEFLYGPRFPTKARKLLHASSNSEGWAHYAEQMMVEQGYGANDPTVALAQRAEALVRDCRYLSAINLHIGKWTLDQAIACFEDQAFMTHANSVEEARRGTFNPTYLYYTAGKLAIIALRDEYMKKFGASLKDFHNAFVAQGALPIPLVRRILLERKPPARVSGDEIDYKAP